MYFLAYRTGPGLAKEKEFVSIVYLYFANMSIRYQAILIPSCFGVKNEGIFLVSLNSLFILHDYLLIILF